MKKSDKYPYRPYSNALTNEHPKITCLGTSIHQVIKDNPHIFTMRLPDEDE
jgi:hypothetical protein